MWAKYPGRIKYKTLQDLTGHIWKQMIILANIPVFDEHTQPCTADFVFCLGSIHTSHQEDKAGEIYSNLKYVHKWLKPRGRAIMRVRSDVELHIDPKTEQLRREPFVCAFLWGIDNIREWGQELGLKLLASRTTPQDYRI